MYLTADQKDDAEKTTLLVSVRGVKVTNIGGWSRCDRSAMKTGMVGVVLEERVHIAKPILGVRKSEVIEFMVARGFEWKKNKRKESNNYLRNWVRNEMR